MIETIFVLAILLGLALLAGMVVSIKGNKTQAPEGKDWFFQKFSGGNE